MKKTITCGVMCLVIMAVLTILGLFEFPYRQLVYTAASAVMFAVCSFILSIANVRMGAKKFFRIKGLSVKDIGMVLLCLSALVCGCFLLNYLTGLIASVFGANISSDAVSALGLSENLLLGIFTVAIVPAVFEELFFRGAVMSSLQDKGVAYAVIVSSALFTLTHGADPYFLSTFFAGCMFSVIVLLTGSIFAAMSVHFLNNIISYILSVYSERLAQVDLDLYMLYAIILILLLSVYGILSTAVRKYKRTLKRERNILNEGEILWQEQYKDADVQEKRS